MPNEKPAKEKLKPCPFCGSLEGVLLEESINSHGKRDGWDIGCWNSFCHVLPETWGETIDIVTKQWNTRI